MGNTEIKVECKGCGSALTAVVREHASGYRQMDTAANQARGTSSVLRADGGWDYYCRECFLREGLRLFKGRIVEER